MTDISELYGLDFNGATITEHRSSGDIVGRVGDGGRGHGGFGIHWSDGVLGRSMVFSSDRWKAEIEGNTVRLKRTAANDPMAFEQPGPNINLYTIVLRPKR